MERAKYPDLLQTATDTLDQVWKAVPAGLTSQRNAIYDALEAERDRCEQEKATRARDAEAKLIDLI